MQFTAEALGQIKAAAQDRAPVSGATHQFYRYPARFSPQFARTVIEIFTREGDLVLDPFVGGGTTAVEALRTNRKFVGTDVNDLAVFVSKVKSTILSEDDISSLWDWLPEFQNSLKISREYDSNAKWQNKGYLRHLNNRDTWRNRNIISAALDEVSQLDGQNLEDFARCVILRSAQLSLDGRKQILSTSQFRRKILENFREMLSNMDILRKELLCKKTRDFPIILKCDSRHLHLDKLFKSLTHPKLILTSPPYPGVHVLYHRWQVKGRKETPAPYWIANKLDGDSERYYTLGGRHEKDLKNYFINLQNAFESMASISQSNTILVQMIAFSNPEWQLERYLSVLEGAGFREFLPGEISSQTELTNGRIWREVPNRKWHASRQHKRYGAHEVVLFHKLI